MQNNHQERPPSGWRSFVFKCLGGGSLAGAVVTTLQIADGLLLFSDVFKFVFGNWEAITLLIWTTCALLLFKLPVLSKLDALFLTFGFFMLIQIVSCIRLPSPNRATAKLSCWMRLLLGLSLFAALYAGSDIALYNRQITQTGNYDGIQKVFFDFYNHWINPSSFLVLNLPVSVAQFVSVLVFYLILILSSFLALSFFLNCISLVVDVSQLSNRVWLILKVSFFLLAINFGLIYWSESAMAAPDDRHTATVTTHLPNLSRNKRQGLAIDRLVPIRQYARQLP